MKLSEGKVMCRRIFFIYAILSTSLCYSLNNGVLVNQGTPFKSMLKNDPRKETVWEILFNPTPLVKEMFSNHEKISGRYRGAWERAKQYFDNGNMVFIRETGQLVGHDFTPDGKLLMDVYNSPFFRELLKNREIFKSENILLKSNFGNDTEFKKKLGPLASYFSSEASMEKLKTYLGEKLFDDLLKHFQKENYLKLAAGLMHVGMHSIMDDDKKVAAIQKNFSDCKINFQWDALRACMAEITYHCRFYKWAQQNITDNFNIISKLLGQLAAYCKEINKPLSDKQKEEIEKIKAKIKAYIAMIEVRLREIKSSGDRMKLIIDNYYDNFAKPYNEENYKGKKKAGQRHEKMIIRLHGAQGDINDFNMALGNTIQGVRTLITELKNMLEHYNKWAECTLEHPPMESENEDLRNSIKNILWPNPPDKMSEALKAKAEEELRKYISGEVEGKKQTRLIISTGGTVSWISMNELNDYISYLNSTWNGNVTDMNNAYGFWVMVDYRVMGNTALGLGYEYLSSEITGSLMDGTHPYESNCSAQGIFASLTMRSGDLIGNLNAFGQVGTGYYTASYTETENSTTMEGDDGGVGLRIAGGFEYKFNETIGLTILGGYRSLEMDDFDAHFFQPGDPPVILDYSGFFISAGVCIHLLK